MKQNTFITTLSGLLAILGWSEEGPEPVSVKLIASQTALITALSWWRAFFREMLTKYRDGPGLPSGLTCNPERPKLRFIASSL